MYRKCSDGTRIVAGPAFPTNSKHVVLLSSDWACFINKVKKNLNISEFINVKMPAPSNISCIYLCLLPAFFFFYVTINLPQCFGIIVGFETVS